MLNVVIFGPPGSGKGTQSEYIIEKFNLAHISTGDLLRTEISGHTQLGTIAKSFIDKGELVPDDTIMGMIDNKIETLVENKGVIFDGFPRTIEQAKALDELLAEYKTKVSVMVNLEVPKDELVTRLLKRGETSGRSDDNMETIEKRISVYESQTKPLIDFYKEKNIYKSIKGVGSINDIFSAICEAIDSVQ